MITKIEKRIRKVSFPDGEKWGTFTSDRKQGKLCAVSNSFDEAYESALKEEGYRLIAKLDVIQEELERIGAVDPQDDPTGWRA